MSIEDLFGPTPKKEQPQQVTPPQETLPSPVEEIVKKILGARPNLTREAVLKLIEEEVAKAAGLLTVEGAAHLVLANLDIQAEEQPPVPIPETKPPLISTPVTSTEDLFSHPAPPAAVASVSVGEPLSEPEGEPVGDQEAQEPEAAVEAELFTGVSPGEVRPVKPQVEATPQATDAIFESSKTRTELPRAPLPRMPDKFDTSPEKTAESRTFLFYGEKGDSKTFSALSFPGRQDILSFDHKTVAVWEESFKRDPRITIYDAIRYMDYSSPDAWLMSSEITLQYINILLDEIRIRSDKPDWIIVDGLEEFTKIAEMVMRYRNGIRMTQGVEWSFWKERRLYLKQIHLKAMGIAKRGLIYTTYPGKLEKVVDGKIVESTKVPRWVDVVKEQTDVVILVESKQTNEGRRFYATIESSKYGPFRTGRRVDITVPPGQTPNVYDLIVKGG
jgi:hypothetical protein